MRSRSTVSQKDENDDLSKDVVRVLLDLYGVVIALALTTAIGITVAPSGIAISPFELNERNLALFGAFFVTVVPFYHGASMYLLKTYKQGHPSSKKGAPLVDFFALAIEGVIFYAIASSIRNLQSFIIWFMFLFLLDIIWWGFTYFKSPDINQAPKWWAILNGIMILFLISIAGIQAELWMQVYTLIFAVAVFRTFLDYKLCYSFYFPPKRKNEPEKTNDTDVMNKRCS